MRTGFWSGLLALWAWAALTAWTAPPVPPLVYKDVAGTLRNYQTELNMTGKFTVSDMTESLRMDGKVQYTTSEKVSAVGADGVATIEAVITDGVLGITLGDEHIDQPLAGYRFTFKRSPRGKVTEMKILNTPDGAIQGMQSMGFGDQWRLMSEVGRRFTFPANPLRMGDSWKSKEAVEVTSGRFIDMAVKATLGGVQTIEGHPYLQIESDATLKTAKQVINMTVGDTEVPLTQSMTLTAQAVTLFDADAGEWINNTLDGNINMTVSTKIPEGTALNIKGSVHIIGGTKKVPPATTTPQTPASPGAG